MLNPRRGCNMNNHTCQRMEITQNTTKAPYRGVISIALADLVQDIKSYSSHWIRENKIFSGFTYWQEGYGAFTYSYSSKESLIEYIRNQELHHKQIPFRDELIALLHEHHIEFNEKYLL